MYDEIDEKDLETPVPTVNARRRWISAVILVGLSLLVAAAIFANREPAGVQIDHEAVLAEQAAYRAAITEASPSLRRARLTDFLNIYPDSDRLLAVKGQLQVIEQAEASDWAVLSDVIFDTEQTAQVKTEALQTYEKIWDTALLGGREAEVKRIRESLALGDLPSPDRDLPIDPDSIPKGVSGETLLGGAGSPRTGYIPRSLPDFESPSSGYSDAVVPPRIQRNRRPKYPRRALERGAEAVVVLELFIDARGRVNMTELVSIDANRYEKDFIRAAERAARRTRYFPKTVNGVPVAAPGIEQTYHFEIGD